MQYAQRAGLADLPLGMSQNDFDKAVLDERNWELAFEGNRWHDLVRRKMVVEVNQDEHPNVSETNRLLPQTWCTVNTRNFRSKSRILISVV